MYRVQVWNDVAKLYVDAHLLFDHIGTTGFRPASDTRQATEFDVASEALRARDELAEFADEICCVFDVTTGKRHFDDSDLAL